MRERGARYSAARERGARSFAARKKERALRGAEERGKNSKKYKNRFGYFPPAGHLCVERLFRKEHTAVMTKEEKISALHRRMKTRVKRRERAKTAALGASCACMTLCLAVMVFGCDPAHTGGPAGMFSGATMLFEHAGVYVLTAICAFFAGTAVTLICIRNQRKRPGNRGAEVSNREEKP
jgi:hypothetical protein